MNHTILLRIAKTVIQNKFYNKYIFDKGILMAKYPFLGENGAAFVTIKYDGNLRGCIGSTVVHGTLFDDVIQNAIAAAFNDSHFNAIDVKELSHLSLEISVLSQTEILEYDNYEDLVSKIRPDIDGLTLEHNQCQETLLPQSWEQLGTPKEFLEHLALKAGATISIYDESPIIYRYSVEHTQRKFDEILSL